MKNKAAVFISSRLESFLNPAHRQFYCIYFSVCRVKFIHSFIGLIDQIDHVTSAGVDDLHGGRAPWSQDGVLGVSQRDREALVVFFQAVVNQVNVPGFHLHT